MLRTVAFVISGLLHWYWLSATLDKSPPLISGGAAQAPIALSVSIASIPTTRRQVEDTEQPQAPAPTNLVKEPVMTPENILSPVPISDSPQRQSTQSAIAQATSEPEKNPLSMEPTAKLDEDKEAHDAVMPRAATTLKRKHPPGLEALPVIKQARFRQTPRPPVYPRQALRRHQQGEALIRVLVNAEGNTQNVFLQRSSGYAILDRSALHAVKGWNFVAAEEDGEPIDAWVEVPVAFKIQ